MFTQSRTTHKQYSPDTDELTQETWKDMRDDLLMSRSTFGAPRLVEVELTYKAYGTEHDLTGVLLNAGPNHPHMRFEDGKHGFLSFVNSAGDDLRLLFERAWDGSNPMGSGKYLITHIKFRSYYFRTPDCPVCDTQMEFGMPEDNEREEFPVSAWLCPECFPGRYERGIK